MKFYMQNPLTGEIESVVGTLENYSRVNPSGQLYRSYHNSSGVLPPLEPTPKPHVPEAPVSSNVPRGGFGKRVL